MCLVVPRTTGRDGLGSRWAAAAITAAITAAIAAAIANAAAVTAIATGSLLVRNKNGSEGAGVVYPTLPGYVDDWVVGTSIYFCRCSDLCVCERYFHIRL